MDCIKNYFYIKEEQEKKFKLFKEIFISWNSKINLISRKDIDFFYLKHVLHSLAIAKYVDLDNTKVIDVGTGGGFPGIPLAIFFPNANFILIDSTKKKIFAVNDIINKIGLNNTKALQVRSNEFNGKFDFVLARAVTNFPKFFNEVKHLIKPGFVTNQTNGIVYLKGGNLKDELKKFERKIFIQKICYYFKENFFDTKKIIHYKF